MFLILVARLPIAENALSGSTAAGLIEKHGKAFLNSPVSAPFKILQAETSASLSLWFAHQYLDLFWWLPLS